MDILQKKDCIIMVGMPGSGKSTIAKNICDKFNYEYISSDVVRNRITGSDRYVDDTMIDIRSLSEQAYNLMYSYAKEIMLKHNKKVVLDATHLDKEKRQNAVVSLLEVVDETRLCYVVVNTPTQIIESRMEKLRNQLSSTEETIYDGWKRVYAIFEYNLQVGKYSWPNTQFQNRRFKPIDEVYIDQLTLS